MINNKRGLAGVGFIFIAIVIFLGVVVIGIYAYSFHELTTALTINESVGQVNLAEAVSSTFGVVDTSMLNSLDFLGLAIIFGCIIGLFLSGYWLSGTSPKLLLIVDLIILVLAFVLAVYVSNTYNTYLTAVNDLGIYAEYMPNSSKFLLNLPLFVGIIGMVTLILYYSGIPKSREDRAGGDISMPEFQ